MERKMLSVYVPPICTGACPNGFHEDLEASSGVPEEQRYALCCLHRRPSFAASGQGKAERILSNSLGSPRIAGIFINYPKSLLEPTQNLVFLGFTINSVEKELSLPAEKLEKIVVEAKTMLKCHTVSARSLAQLIGRMTAAILAVHPAPLQYQGLQHLEHLALRRKGYNGQVTLSLGARKDLHWWVKNLATWNGRVVQEVTTDVVIETDASKMGWGANPDRRLLECSGSRTTHQFPGNVSSILCNQSLHQGSSGNLSFTAYRQHVCGDLCQSNGGDNVSVTYCPGNRSLVLVPTEKNHSCSTVHSRYREYHGRLPVEASKRQDGLGVRTHHFQLCENSIGTASGGSFCNTFFKATSPFLQLATRP